LRAINIVIGRLQQFQNDVLDIFTDITRFRERRGVSHCEWNIENACERLRKQRLARARWPHEQDVRFRKLNIIMFRCVVQTLVVIMNRNGENFFRMFLADDIVIENFADFLRRRHTIA
jgi:hypothetical protein